MTVSILWIGTAVVMIVALVILKKSLDAETETEVNLREIAIHISVFVIFAADCTFVSITNVTSAVEYNKFPKPLLIEGYSKVFVIMKHSVDATTSATVLTSVCGWILIYIFLKIIKVVRDGSAEKERIARENFNLSSSHGIYPQFNVKRLSSQSSHFVNSEESFETNQRINILALIEEIREANGL